MTTTDPVRIERYSRVLAQALVMIEKHDQDYVTRYRLVFGALYAALAVGMSGGVREDPAEPGWPVVYIQLPTGQVSWHVPEYEVPWDGHDTPEKYRRCREYCAMWGE